MTALKPSARWAVVPAVGCKPPTTTPSTTRSAGAGASWKQKAYIKASNTDQSDGFGGSIALSGGTLAIGAGGEQSSAAGLNGDQNNNSKLRSGAVYVRRIAP